MLENSQQEIHSIFSAIALGNIEEIKEIIKKDSSVLRKTNSNGYTPIFSAIHSRKPEVVKNIIKENPFVLKQIDQYKYTPIFYAIRFNNLEIFEAIIEEDRAVLNQKDPNGDTPIFLAIIRKNPEIVKMIIKENPLVLKQIDRNGNTPISLATSISCGSLPYKKTKKSEVLKIILQNQFQANITEDEQDDLEEFFLQKSLLKGLYSKGRSCSELNKLKNTFDKITSENTFDNIYKELFEKVDNNKPIDLDDGKKMFIFSSNLTQHQSFFIFHVDQDNKLTSISYCDGHSIDAERKIKGSETHIKGVTTFNLKNPIEYYDDFVKNFIEKNSENKSTEDFRLKFKNQEIEAVNIDYSKTTHSIPTKIQRRGNCVFKSTSLLARFISEKLDPTMNFDFDIDTQKTTGAGHDEYKKFKDDLTIKALNCIMKLVEKISSKSDSFSEYLRKEIDDIITMVETQNTKKLSKDHPRKEFHEAIRDALSGYEQKNPSSSCFPFFRSCFPLKNTPHQPKASLLPF